MALEMRDQFHQHFTSSFMRRDPKSVKRHRLLDCLFTLLGSLRAKAGRKHVGEINPRGGEKHDSFRT